MFGLFKKKPEISFADQIYEKAVMQARNPEFYTQMGVPDTLDGRFDMISLHVILVLRRVKDSDPALSQAVFDVMFRDMSLALREMGIGDMGIPKHMKRMMQGFNGRAQAYQNALENSQGLEEVLIRNVYGTVDNPGAHMVKGLIRYIERADQNFRNFSLEEFLDGRTGYPDI